MLYPLSYARSNLANSWHSYASKYNKLQDFHSCIKYYKLTIGVYINFVFYIDVFALKIEVLVYVY